MAANRPFYGGMHRFLPAICKVPLNNNVLVRFSMMVYLMSIMFLMMGVLSELLARIYHESQDRKPYKVRHIYRGAAPDAVGSGPEAGNPTSPKGGGEESRAFAD
jgi:hypothetical protein